MEQGSHRMSAWIIQLGPSRSINQFPILLQRKDHNRLNIDTVTLQRWTMGLALLQTGSREAYSAVKHAIFNEGSPDVALHSAYQQQPRSIHANHVRLSPENLRLIVPAFCYILFVLASQIPEPLR